MKKTTRTFLIAAVLGKVFLVCVFLLNSDLVDLPVGKARAIASEPAASPAVTMPVPGAEDGDDAAIDMALLLQKMETIRAKEKALAIRSSELSAFENEIDRKIETLTQLRDEIKAQMARRQTIEQQKIKHLMKAYAAMKPQSAAGLIERLDRQFAIELLGNMKGEEAGKILTYVDKEKAADLIEGLVRRN